jgi:aminocyclitol acetyltransferase
MGFVEGREIVLWGNGTVAINVVKDLKYKGYDFSFSVSNDIIDKEIFCDRPVKKKCVINRELHYIIISSAFYDEISKELDQLGYKEKNDYYCWDKRILEYDFLWDNIFIGRNSYGYRAFESVLGVNSNRNVIVSIGRFTSINVSARMQGDHPISRLSTGLLSFIEVEDKKLYETKYAPVVPKNTKITIGNDVWIGANSFINYSKVKQIGDGAVIGTGAVVIKDVPPYAVVAGVPAKIIKYRFTEEQIKILENVKWWNWDENKLRQHAEFFFNPEMFFEKYQN